MGLFKVPEFEPVRRKDTHRFLLKMQEYGWSLSVYESGCTNGNFSETLLLDSIGKELMGPGKVQKDVDPFTDTNDLMESYEALDLKEKNHDTVMELVENVCELRKSDAAIAIVETTGLWMLLTKKMRHFYVAISTPEFTSVDEIAVKAGNGETQHAIKFTAEFVNRELTLFEEHQNQQE